DSCRGTHEYRLPTPTGPDRARSVLGARRPGDQLAQALADAAEQRRRFLRRRRRLPGGGRRLRLLRARLALPARLPAPASAFPAAFALRLAVLRLALAAYAAPAAATAALARRALALGAGGAGGRMPGRRTDRGGRGGCGGTVPTFQRRGIGSLAGR